TARARARAVASSFNYRWSEVHSAAHSAATRRHGGGLLLRHFGDHRLGGDEQAGHGGRGLQRGAHDLGRGADPLRHPVAVLAALRIEAEGVLILLQDLADDHGAVFARVDHDLARRRRERLAHDLDPGLLIVVVGPNLLERFGGAQERDAAARQDAFLDRGAGRVHGIIHAVLALLHFDLGRPTDADHRDAAGELGQPLLQFLTIVVGGGFLDLRLDLRDAGLDVGLLAGAADDRGVLLVDRDLLGAAQHVEGDVLELDAEILGDRLAAGQDSDVLQHRLAAIAEARSFDGGDLEP